MHFNVFLHSDRFRTTINVMCDALGTIIVDHLSKGELRGAPVRIVIFLCFARAFSTKFHVLIKQEDGEPHELLELRHEKD